MAPPILPQKIACWLRRGVASLACVALWLQLLGLPAAAGPAAADLPAGLAFAHLCGTPPDHGSAPIQAHEHSGCALCCLTAAALLPESPGLRQPGEQRLIEEKAESPDADFARLLPAYQSRAPPFFG